MASSPCNSYFEAPIVEQVIAEFFAKILHIILESRSPYVSSRNYSVERFTSSPASSSSSSSSRPRDKWFNLALRDCPAALKNFDIWRRSNLDPLVIDVLLVHWSSASNATRLSPGGCLLQNFSGKDLFPMGELKTKHEKIVERWIVQYESRKGSRIDKEMYSGSRKRSGSRKSSGASSHSSEIQNLCKKICKRTAVMVRSLYVLVKLLPAYKIFQELNSSSGIRRLSLSHRITSFTEPFTRAEDAEMKLFSFVPIDTPCGRLSLTVSYLPELEEESLEPSPPLSPQFIMDYVGCPTTNRFQSVPSAAPLPRYVSITMPHGWSNDHGGMPSGSSSLSPTYSEVTHYNPSVRLLPHHLYDRSHKKNISFDDPSLSSPPTHFPSGHLPNAPLRPKSAPICIPRGRNIGFPNQAPPPSSPKPERPGYSPQISTATVSQTSCPEGKLQTKKEQLRLGYFETGMSLAKALSFGKDEAGHLPRLKCNLPNIPLSRSSSRLSLLDEFDDSEFACPFADDEDRTESWNRDQVNENLESRGLVPVSRSPDAAVGALVQMLKTASPLQQNLSNLVGFSFRNQRIHHNKGMEAEVEKSESPASNSGIAASGLFKPRTAADALDELRIYKQMKELLLQKGGSKSLGDNNMDEPGGS